MRERAPRNRTITLREDDRIRLRPRLDSPTEGIYLGTFQEHLKTGIVAPASVDLLFLDPPYNLNKTFGAAKFKRQSVDSYTDYLREIIAQCIPYLKPTATVYICGDWHTSQSIYAVASEFFTVRNRITWEREKGRGSLTNWKNASEDVWFCTASDTYTFNVDAVKLRRQVRAPYTENGAPKDWQEESGKRTRDTHPSNLWTDITIPFWSMPENTDHPTQKSEKLLAKLLLASTKPGDLVFDPFLGSGTTAVVAKKLGRACVGIELDEEYALLALRRLELAEISPSIQGLQDGVFWERNSVPSHRV